MPGRKQKKTDAPFKQPDENGFKAKLKAMLVKVCKNDDSILRSCFH